MIKVQNLSKKYGPHTALENVEFTIPDGKVVGFLGPNGAGKSTTMKILTGLMKPTTGSVLLDGHDISENPLEVQKRIGYLPEIPPLYDDMTVREYLKFVCELKQVEKSKIKEYVEDTISKVKLGEVAHRLIAKLSKGYRQRVGLAQAIVSKPKFVILDEPTSGFDPQQVSEFKSLIKSLAGQCTVFLSSHILADVESICSEIIVLNKGHVIAQGSYTDIQKKWKQRHQVRVQVDRPAPDWDKALQSIDGVTGVRVSEDGTSVVIEHTKDDVTNEVLQLAMQHGLRILNVDNQAQNLEELFLDLTKNKESAP
ncbi:MAG: ABC transporter ATP-binding protein [Bdellovibrionales bacterium]|nr:ABC transporter ATP-binding protein [Bdellovibrionales bacterium]